MSIRVLIADDSALFRRVLSDALGAIPGVEVVGSVSNGRLAVQRQAELKPDLLTLDMEMPEMDGLAVLDALRAAKASVEVIVVSAVTRKGGLLTMQALEKGAFDFITKPETTGVAESKDSILRELTPRIKALAHRLEIRSILRDRPAGSAPVVAPPPKKPVVGGLDAIAERMNTLTSTVRPELVLIGISTGGPNALAQMLPQIPANLGVPILIVQHMPPVFTSIPGREPGDQVRHRCP